MNRFLLLITIAFTFSTVSAQNSKPYMLYQKYKGEEGIVSIWVPGVAIRLASSIADLEKEERAFLKSVKSVRVLTIEDKDIYRGTNFVKEAKVDGDCCGYKSLMEIHDNGDDVIILGREINGRLKDLLVLVGGDENVMVHIKGRKHADMVNSLALIAGFNNNKILTSL